MTPVPDPLNVAVLLSKRSPREINPFLDEEPSLERVRAVSPGHVNVSTLRVDIEVPQEEREAALRDAHVLFLASPIPKDLLELAPNAMWMHHAVAGVSNLRTSPLWGTSVTMTSSRGYTNAFPIAETVMGAVYIFAKRFNWAVVNGTEGKFDRSHFQGMTLLEGKTIGIIGLGGIGGHVARLARANGMRVVATRRSAEQHMTNVDSVDELFPTDQQNEMLGQCHFVAVCAMLTEETHHIVGRAAFDSMRDGAFILNISRADLIDEEALAEALKSEKVAGAYLDLWTAVGTGPTRTPIPQLMSDPRVIFTPHMSGWVDEPQPYALDIFCENLGRFLKGDLMDNVIDWERGY